MSPLAIFHRLAHDTYSSLLLSMVPLSLFPSDKCSILLVIYDFNALFNLDFVVNVFSSVERPNLLSFSVLKLGVLSFTSSLKSQVRSFKASTWEDTITRISLWWEQARAVVAVPVFKFLVALCLIMSVMLFVEMMYMGLVVAYIKLFKRKPEKVYKWEAMEEDDVECGSESFPMVLVQIPMYNEKEALICLYNEIDYLKPYVPDPLYEQPQKKDGNIYKE
ncbi:hypothetical protein F2Q70_00008385 [Brassica cretica]|uniref:Glycosyltransferase 2-like domain-containing protein n=1 Tax=Brassica cretica TaxID=69181 RepID=A0A8S9M660_BRACR|nr:hypothetical protein F2Q70_00008385 [Brassica cretica]